MAIKGYQGGETRLFIDNDERLYRQKINIRENLIRHMCRGQFSHVKARKGFKHLTDEANRRYKKDFGGGGLNTAERRDAAAEYVQELVRDVRGYIQRGQQDLTREEIYALNSKSCKVNLTRRRGS